MAAGVLNGQRLGRGVPTDATVAGSDELFSARAIDGQVAGDKIRGLDGGSGQATVSRVAPPEVTAMHRPSMGSEAPVSNLAVHCLACADR